MTKKKLSLIVSLLLHGLSFYCLLYIIDDEETEISSVPKPSIDIQFLSRQVAQEPGENRVAQTVSKNNKAVRKRAGKPQEVEVKSGGGTPQVASEPADGDGGAAFEQSLKGGQKARLVSGLRVRVPYPRKARQYRVEGRVKMLLSISKVGAVEQVEIISGPGFGLTTAAQTLAKKLVFLPATDAMGQAMASQIEHEVIFRLTDAIVESG